MLYDGRTTTVDYTSSDLKKANKKNGEYEYNGGETNRYGDIWGKFYLEPIKEENFIILESL